MSKSLSICVETYDGDRLVFPNAAYIDMSDNQFAVVSDRLASGKAQTHWLAKMTIKRVSVTDNSAE